MGRRIDLGWVYSQHSIDRKKSVKTTKYESINTGGNEGNALRCNPASPEKEGNEGLGRERCQRAAAENASPNYSNDYSKQPI